MQTDIRSSQTFDFRCFEKPHTKRKPFDRHADPLGFFKLPVDESRTLKYLVDRPPDLPFAGHHEWFQEHLAREWITVYSLLARGFAKAVHSWIDINYEMSKQQERAAPKSEGFQYEKESFEKMKDELLNKCEGEYVAIYGGKVVDHGKDQIEVLNRVYQKYGYVEVYCHLVTKEPVTYQIATPFET